MVVREQSHLLVFDGVETGCLDPVGEVVEPHVTQHHDSAEQQGCGVGKVHASDVRGSAVHLKHKHTHVKAFPSKSE